MWLGSPTCVVVEIGSTSPPVGMNLFVLNTLLPQVPTRTIFRGVLPFMAADCVRLAILVAFPVISTYLRSEEHTSELQSRPHLVCRLLLEKKNNHISPRLIFMRICR